MIGRDEIRDALRVQKDATVDGKSLSMVSLHHIDAEDIPIPVHKLFPKDKTVWGDAEAMADILFARASRHARGQPGTQKFWVCWWHGIFGGAARTIRFTLPGSTAAHEESR